MNEETKQPQQSIDNKNAEFWDTLCGSQLAKQLGIIDDSPESLLKFDDWYFDFYPYLFTHIPFTQMEGKKVLEVGLGYGTVAQKIAESGADYKGLDIAAGPVDMVNLRLEQGRLNGEAVQGSVLQSPFEDEFFDWVVAIGCLHHTGDLAAAINEVHRLLKTGGKAMIMVYNACSYRQFQTSPIRTLRRLLAKPGGLDKIGNTAGNKKARAAYDTTSTGEAAPQTEFVTSQELAVMCDDFSDCSIVRENIGEDGVFRPLPRHQALRFGKMLGLDLYCRLKK